VFFFVSVWNGSYVSWQVFFAWFFVLVGANVLLLLRFWQKRRLFSMRLKALAILGGGIVVWYWFFAPLYYFFSVNLNALQLTFAGFLYTWELPIVGGLFLVVALKRFRPIAAYEADKKKPEDPAHFYRAVRRYPTEVAVLLFFLSVFAYGVGALQMQWFAFQPPLEQAKAFANGFVIAIFLSLFYYLFLDAFLERVRTKLKREYDIKGIKRQKAAQRVFFVILCTAVGSVGLVGLLVLQSWQVLEKESVLRNMRDDAAQVALRLSQELQERQAGGTTQAQDNMSLFETLKQGERGQVVFLGAGETLPAESFSRRSREFVAQQPFGVLEDLKKEHKVVIFFEDATLSKKVVVVAFLSEFYSIFLPPLRSFSIGAVLVLLLVTVMAALVSFALTDRVRRFSALVQQAERGEVDSLFPVPSDDELESLSRSFIDYAKATKEIDRTKSEFVSLASHQLRTPLTITSWYAERLESKIKEQDYEAQLRYLRAVQKANERMTKLLEALLNVSRIELGTISLQAERVDCVLVAESVLEEFVPQIREKDLVFDKAYDKKGAYCLGDGEFLHMALENIVSNAVRYTPSGGEISLRVVAERNTVRVEIRDTGCGIPREQQSKVFTKMFRADNAAQIDRMGSGLGLYITKWIVEQSGGKIWFESEEGRGTIFYIQLPRYQEKGFPGKVGLWYNKNA